AAEHSVLSDEDVADDSVESEPDAVDLRGPDSFDHKRRLVGLIRRNGLKKNFRDAELIRDAAAAAEVLLQDSAKRNGDIALVLSADDPVGKSCIEEEFDLVGAGALDKWCYLKRRVVEENEPAPDVAGDPVWFVPVKH